jgi:hypothetical protein
MSDHNASTSPTTMIAVPPPCRLATWVRLWSTSRMTLCGTMPFRWVSRRPAVPGPARFANTPTITRAAEGSARKRLNATAWARFSA